MSLASRLLHRGATSAFRRRVAFSTAAHLPLNMLSEEEIMLQDMVRSFARERVAPRVQAMDEASLMDKELISGMFEAGLMGVEIPAEYGGSEMGFLSACLVVEEMAKVDASVSVCVDVHNTLINNVIARWASDDVKARYWPRLAKDTLGSFCLSEPGSGSDAFSLKTRATKQSDGSYLLNGSKAWITNGGEAGLFLVFANVDPSLGYKGITCFIVERDAPGFSIGKREKKLGIRASSTVPLSFSDVRVPAENVLGQVGQGYKVSASACVRVPAQHPHAQRRTWVRAP